MPFFQQTRAAEGQPASLLKSTCFLAGYPEGQGEAAGGRVPPASPQRLSWASVKAGTNSHYILRFFALGELAGGSWRSSA